MAGAAVWAMVESSRSMTDAARTTMKPSQTPLWAVVWALW